jgi:glycosyltransferase involved in cell wall biosynthesis
VGDVVRLEQGMRPIEQIVPLILEADVGVVPIIDDPFTQYMLPVKLLEYVAVGIPSIASRTATIEAYFDDTMVAFTRPGDPEDLAAQVRALYRDPARRERLALAANRFNEAHSWERERETYYQLVDSLAGSEPATQHRQTATRDMMEVGAL